MVQKYMRIFLHGNVCKSPLKLPKPFANAMFCDRVQYIFYVCDESSVTNYCSSSVQNNKSITKAYNELETFINILSFYNIG